MMLNEPYFMSNTAWYVKADPLDIDNWPEDDRGYHLTDKAPQEAVDSYNEFYGITPESLAETAG